MLRGSQKSGDAHERYYVIHKPDTPPETLAEADICIQDILNGTARKNHYDWHTVALNRNGAPFLPSQLLDRYLSKLPLKEFPYEEAVAFCDALRRLAGWIAIRYALEEYVEHQVQERFFEVEENEDWFSSFPALHRAAGAAAGGCGREPAALCLLCRGLPCGAWRERQYR